MKRLWNNSSSQNISSQNISSQLQQTEWQMFHQTLHQTIHHILHQTLHRIFHQTFIHYNTFTTTLFKYGEYISSHLHRIIFEKRSNKVRTDITNLMQIMKHFFNTSSTILWNIFNNSMKHLQQSMKQFFNTFSSHTFTILPQQTIQDLVTKLSFTIYDAILYHNTFTTIHSQFMMQYFITILSQQFIKLFSKTFEHSFHNKLSSIVEILMIDASSLFNISSQHLQQTSHHNIFNKHLITTSSTNISSQHLQQTFQQTIIQFFIKTCRWVSYNLFKHHILQHIFTQQMVTDIIHHSPTNLYHNIFHFFITVHDTVLYHIMQTS